MSNRINESEAIAFLKGHDNFLIFTHNSPDADTIGSAIALVASLRALGKTAVAFNREGVPERLAFLEAKEYFRAELPCDLSPFTLVSVDVASPKMLSDGDETLTFALSIDHHEINSISCDNLYLHADYPAAGEIVYELIKGLGVGIDQTVAGALYAAISSDSGGFRYDSTRPETMYAAAELMRAGIDFAKINRLLFDSKSPAQIAVEKLAYEKLEFHFGGKFVLVAVTQEDLDRIGAEDSDTEVLNQIPRTVAGALVSAVIKPKGTLMKCSMRSNEMISVAEIAAQFSGGGHYHAAGFSKEGATVEEFRRLVIDAVGKKLESL